MIAVRVAVPGYSFPIAVERPWAGYANATAAAGQSYVSGDGVTWTDMTRALPDTDVCLKGYGVSSEQPAPDPTPTPEPSATPTPGPAPTVTVGDAVTGPAAFARIVFRVAHAEAESAAAVRLTVRTHGGAVVRRQTLHDVSIGARHTWRVLAPARRGTYVVTAVATLGTGAVSKRATAALRVR